MVTMSGAEFIARSLDNFGVTHVFFVPTILSRTLYEIEQRTSIARIATHGEKAAAYMADGYARATGRPGVCMAQTVGAANLAAGLRDGFMGCSPIVAMSGGPDDSSMHRNTYQQVDDFPMFNSVTKFNAQVRSTDRLPDLLGQAFREATSGKPGPAHLQMAGHHGDVVEDGHGDFPVPRGERFAMVPAHRPEPSNESTAALAKLIEAAERPIVVAGGGVRSSDASQELRQFLERWSIPAATSMNAKDVLPGSHPNNVGVVGQYSRASANRAVLASDLVVFIGSRTGSQVTAKWQVPPIGHPVAQIDVDPRELGRHYPTKIGILGDAKVSLQRLLQHSGPDVSGKRKQWLKDAAMLVTDWHLEYDTLLKSTATPIRPERVMNELGRHLPDDAIVVADTGHAGMWTASMLDLDGASQRFIRAAGSLGWAFPASLGAKLAVRDRPVVAFVGDGGFWYHIGELETAARWGINAVIVVNNNNSQNQEVSIYTRAYGGTLHGNHGELWKFTNVDFAAVAESMGAKGITVKKPSDLPSALEQGFEAQGPVVLDVKTDIEAMAPLPLVVRE